MNKIIELLHAEQCSCVISKGEETRIFNQKGIADLYDLVCRCPHFLEGATVADKVVGKAAAALMIKGGIKQLHADIISLSALSLLQKHHLMTAFETLVPHIKNRSGMDWCPLEKRCNKEESVEGIFALIQDFVKYNLPCTPKE